MTYREFQQATTEHTEKLWFIRKYGTFNLDKRVDYALTQARALRYTQAGKRRRAYLRDMRSETEIAWRIYQENANLL